MAGTLLLLFFCPGCHKSIRQMLFRRDLFKIGLRLANRYADFRTVCCYIRHLLFPLFLAGLYSTQIISARNAAAIAIGIGSALKAGPPGN